MIEKIDQATVSLDAPVGDKDDDMASSYGDFIPDDKILSLRHGLTDGIQHTLEEVGKMFGVTRERIRQIEAKAHEKIRQHDKVNRLKNY